MLPSQGLFKGTPCPYFNAMATCRRPFCHFNHIKIDQNESTTNKQETTTPTNTESSIPVYKATPKLLALPLPPLLPTKKKVLEYTPDNPGINCRSKRSSEDSQPTAPTYIPAPTKETTKDEINPESIDNNETPMNVDIDDLKEEFDEIDEIISNQLADSIVRAGAKAVIIISDDDEPVESNKKSNGAVQKENKVVTVANEKIVKDEKERRHSSSSSTSNRVHKSKSSDKEKLSTRDRKSSGSDKKDRDRHRTKEESSSSSLSSRSSKHKSSSHRSSRDKDKSKEKSTSSSCNSSKRHHSSKSISSSSKRDVPSSTSSDIKTKSKRDDAEQKSATTVSVPDESADLEDNLNALFATSAEDIMQECVMVYNQLEQELASKKTNGAETPNQIELKRKSSIDVDEQSGVPQKKRIAYEKAEEKNRDLKCTKFVGKPNHLLNARQAIFNRQMDARKKEEEEAAASEAAIREAEEKVRKANEELRLAQEKKLTPLIPKSYLTPTIPNKVRTIAPVCNIIALERAKKKVEELKAEKSAQSFTPAQTLKGTGRVAHKPTTTAVSKVEPAKQPKPPVLEANSTKIYFNLRMQYYEKMVQYCTSIYPNIADAWERAQAEELAVFKKCSTPVIYKSSALLAINKLRKEAADSGNKPPDNNRLISHEVILAGKLATNSHWSIEKKS